MNTLLNWLIRRAIRRSMSNGLLEHTIKGIYNTVRSACVELFTEDNTPTMHDYLHSLFAATTPCPVCLKHMRSRDALQARLDAVMLEHCPDEMTPVQLHNWAKHQAPADFKETD